MDTEEFAYILIGILIGLLVGVLLYALASEIPKEACDSLEQCLPEDTVKVELDGVTFTCLETPRTDSAGIVLVSCDITNGRRVRITDYDSFRLKGE